MAFLTPALATLIGTVATTALSLSQAGQAKRRASKNRLDAAAAASEAQRKEDLLLSRENQTRRRRAAGAGQAPTILGGEDVAGKAEIGRNVLLGQ